MNKGNKRNVNGEYLTMQIFADEINCSVNTARKVAKAAGAIRKIGRRPLVNRKVAMDYIEGQAIENN